MGEVEDQQAGTNYDPDRELMNASHYVRIKSEGGYMRRLYLIALAAAGTAALMVFQSSSAANLQAQSAFAGVAAGGGNASDLRGGPNGVVKTVLRGTELPVDGLMVQLISHKTSIRTTVYTNERGQFEFPKLESGDYVLRVPRPMEFRRYEKDLVRIDGATKLPDIVMERITNGLFLPPTRDILAQLSGAEWLANMPGTAQEKRLFTNGCTNSCHGGDRPFMQKFSPADWVKVVDRMTNYTHRILTNASGRKDLNANAKVIADWLGRVRNLDSEYPEIEPFPRPTGVATRAIVTEYELPYTLVHIHDVAGDAQGNVWFNVNRSPFVGNAGSQDRQGDELPPAGTGETGGPRRGRRRPLHGPAGYPPGDARALHRQEHWIRLQHGHLASEHHPHRPQER